MSGKKEKRERREANTNPPTVTPAPATEPKVYAVHVEPKYQLEYRVLAHSPAEAAAFIREKIKDGEINLYEDLDTQLAGEADNYTVCEGHEDPETFAHLEAFHAWMREHGSWRSDQPEAPEEPPYIYGVDEPGPGGDAAAGGG